MSVKITVEEKGDVKYVSYSKKEDYKAIKLKSNGLVYVEHVDLANNLLKRDLATEAKSVKFSVEAGTSKFIEDVKK